MTPHRAKQKARSDEPLERDSPVTATSTRRTGSGGNGRSRKRAADHEQAVSPAAEGPPNGATYGAAARSSDQGADQDSGQTSGWTPPAAPHGARDGTTRAEASCAQELLRSLFHELFQTEESASLHPRREAARLGDSPPAQALNAVARHAQQVLQELPALAESRKLPVSRVGQLVGRLFSDARQWVADRMLEPERSYRGTLLGMRHGVDLVLLIRDIARVEGDSDLEVWCSVWLAEREPLIESVAYELRWFAATPEVALHSPSRVVRELLGSLRERMSSLLSRREASPADAPTG